MKIKLQFFFESKVVHWSLSGVSMVKDKTGQQVRVMKSLFVSEQDCIKGGE